MSKITSKNIEEWLSKAAAITLRQPLVSALAEDAGHRVYPPTFPKDDNYFVDAIESGGNRSIIDTKQSQARRLAAKLVGLDEQQSADSKILPDVTVEGASESRHVGQIGHRVADAAVLLADGVGEKAEAAMKSYATGDSTALGTYFPESLLFGFWDSHGLLGKKATMAKRSRIIHSEIYAYEVSPARSRSVYVAAAPVLVGDEEYNAEKEDEKLSEAGLANAIGKLTRDGVVAKHLERSAEINLATLRQIKCLKDGKVDAVLTAKLQAYLLTLALATLLTPDSDELNLRSGAHLVPVSAKTKAQVLMRDGTSQDIDVSAGLLEIAAGSAKDWFKAATGSAKAPSLSGKIGKGKVGEVRKSLKKGKAAAAEA
jgi:CRISPR-associated protein Csb1